MERLATFVCMCKDLQTLSLRNCTIENDSFSLLCDRFFTLKHLAKIDFSGNRVTDQGVENGIPPMLSAL